MQSFVSLCGEGNLIFLCRLKPITLEAMLPNMEASIAPHLCLLSVGNLGNILPMSSVNVS